MRARVRTLSAFGDFSQIEFPMVGLGEPRVVRAGVVGGSYFAVMGSYITDVRIPGALPLAAAAGVLITAGILAVLVPAARASRVDVIQALRAE